jgi:hypothetical protein
MLIGSVALVFCLVATFVRGWKFHRPVGNAMVGMLPIRLLMADSTRVPTMHVFHLDE